MYPSQPFHVGGCHVVTSVPVGRVRGEVGLSSGKAELDTESETEATAKSLEREEASLRFYLLSCSCRRIVADESET